MLFSSPEEKKVSRRKAMTLHFQVLALTVFFFSAAMLFHFHINEQTPTQTLQKLTVIIIGVSYFLPVPTVVAPPLAIFKASAHLPVESLLLQDLLLPWRWRRARVVVETREEV